MKRTLPRLALLSVLAIPTILTMGLNIRSAPRTLRATLVGVVLPADRRIKEKVTGSVTLDPKAFADMPAVQVVEAMVPLEADETGHASLDGVVIDVPGRPQTPAGVPVVVTVPEEPGPMKVTLRRDGSKTGIPVSVPLPAGGFREETPVAHGSLTGTSEPATPETTEPRSSKTTEPKSSTTTERQPSTTTETRAPKTTEPRTATTVESTVPAPIYDTPAVATAGGTDVVRGPFRGDGRRTRVTINGIEAPIFGETPRAVYFHVPNTVKPGRAHILVKEGGVLILLPVEVARLDLAADRLQLLRGESTKFHAGVSGPETMTEAEWKSGPPSPLASLSGVTKEATFHAPKKGEPGALLLTLENASSKTITVDELPTGFKSKSLDRAAFRAGPYRMDGTIRSVQSGNFNVHAVLIPFLEFPQSEGLSAENCGGPNDSVSDDDGLPLPPGTAERVEERKAAGRMRALRKAREAADDAEEIARRYRDRHMPSPDADEAAKELRKKADEMAGGMSKEEVAKVADDQAKDAEQTEKWREDAAATAQKKADENKIYPKLREKYQKEADGYTCEAELAKKKADELRKEAKRLREGTH